MRITRELPLIFPLPPKFLALALLALSLLMPSGATSQSSEPDIETPFRAGQAALRQGDFSRAVEDFKKVLSLDPDLVEAKVNLGLAYQSLLDYQAAVRYIAPALRERPDLPGLNVIAGMDYIKLGSPEKALPFLEHALKLDPSSRDAHEAMALYDLTQQNIQGAAEQYRRVADLTSEKPEALFTLGHQYVDLAARLAIRGAVLYLDSPWGHRFLGDMLVQRNRWEEAALEYKKAIAIEPRQPGLHSLLGEAWLHAGKLDDAEAEFHQELQSNARYQQAWLGFADLQLARGQALDALASVNKIWQSSPEFLKSRPEFPSVELSSDIAQACVSRLLDQPESPAKHFLLSALYTSMNDNPSAERQWQSFQNDLAHMPARPQASSPNPCKVDQYSLCVASLKRTKPLTSSAWLLLGKTYYALQQYESAAEALAQVHGDKNANSEASYWLERTYQALGAASYAQLQLSFPGSWRSHQLLAEGFALRADRDNAIKEYQAAIQLAPNNAELHESLGEFYLDNHSEQDAQRELEQAAALDSNRTKTLYLLGRLYVQDNDNEKAVAFLRRALQLQPNLNAASGLLGTAYVRLGQFDDAARMLEKAAPLDHMGNIHYQLYQAYRKLGKTDLAQKALARSQEIRRNSLEHDQALVMGSQDVEPDQQ
jgi:tetratricopeptide (TPR) repeat protein